MAGSLVACTADEFIARARIPGTSTPARFVLVHERAEYIDATIETGGFTLRFFLPGSGDCAVLAHVDEMVRYLAESEEDEAWLVLRWGSAPKQQQLRERIAGLCDNVTAWELRYVDVLRLVPAGVVHKQDAFVRDRESDHPQEPRGDDERAGEVD